MKSPLKRMAGFFDLEGLTAFQQRALAITFGASLVNVMGNSLVYPVLPVLVKKLSISESEAGLVIAAFSAPAIFLGPVFGTLADLRGRRRILLFGLVLFGIAGSAVAFAPSFKWIIALRAVQGIGMSAIAPLVIVLVGDILKGDQETSGQGLKVVLDRVALIVFPPLGGLLAVASWSAPFLLYALTLPLALAALAWMPETRGPAPQSLGHYFRGMFEALRVPQLGIAFGAVFLRFFLDYGFFTFFPLLLARRGGSAALNGMLFTVYAVGAILTASRAGRLGRALGLNIALAIAFLTSAAAVGAAPFLGSFWLWGAVMLAYGLANGMISPLQKSILTRNAPPDMRGGVIAVDRLSQQVAKSSSPALLGLLIMVTGLESVFWILSGLTVISVAAASVIVFRRVTVSTETDTPGLRSKH